jgi:hypothetical protein
MEEPVKTRDPKGNEILRWYYVNLDAALNPLGDREEAIVSVPPNRIQYDYIRRETILDVSTIERECAQEHLPVNVLLDPGELMNWQMAYLQSDPEKLPERVERWKSIQQEVVEPFRQYQLPVIGLRKETSKEAVCKVFEKVNTGGVSLTAFELLTATFAADNYSLRDDWKVRKRRLSQKRVLKQVAATDFLQTVTLLATLDRKRNSSEAAVSAKRRDMLQLSLPEYEKWAEPATQGYERAARLLFTQKIFAAKDVPYQSQLIPLAAILADLDDKWENDGVRHNLVRWIWCGVLGELYGSATETRFAKDVPQVLEWVQDGPEPETVKEAHFAPVRLRTLRTRNSAAYKGVHALVMQRGAEDFKSGESIDAQTYFDERVDIHHIFPFSWCMKNNINRGLADSIINKTALSATTNRSIGGSAPSVYIPRLERQAGMNDARMNEILQSHLIDSNAVRVDDFYEFLGAREGALLDLIEDATGKPVSQAGPTDEGLSDDLVTALDGGPPQTIHLPQEARGLLIVEGDTDETYLLLAVDTASRPELLDGIHIVAAGGVNKAVMQALLLKNQTELPIVVLFDRDGPGKAGRDTLVGRFGFQNRREVMTYGDVFDAAEGDIEAEDLFPTELWQAFIEEYGEDNVLSEKVKTRDGRWHYGFNGHGKELVGTFLREIASPNDVHRWIHLLESIRTRFGLDAVP